MRELLLSKLAPYKNNKVLIYNNQNTDDIITVLLKAHNLYKTDYDNIAAYFWKGSIERTCRFIWYFLKQNVKYKVEPDSRQSVKSPAAILSTGIYKNGYNDCKHYSQMIAGILSALCRKGIKISWCYRFANYKLFSTTPHHVFVVVKKDNSEIWIDPVLEGYNLKKPYINKIDKKI
jgi:hypothetical protein